MSGVSTFYASEHVGNLFGVKGPLYGPHGHLGVDFNRMPAGTSIPAWRAGTVVKRGTSRNLGNYLIVRTDIGYVGYHHMQGVAFTPVGAEVEVGQIIGRLGMTGRLATGVHLHTTLADSSIVGGQDVHDPLPHIRGTSTASTTSTPITQEELMAQGKAQGLYTDGTGPEKGHTMRFAFDIGSGFFLKWTESGATNANWLAKELDTGNAQPTTASMAGAIERACAKVAAGG
jgi:hypothetical protein